MGWTDPRDDVTLWWKLIGRNKRTVVLDLKDPADLDRMRRLLATAAAAVADIAALGERDLEAYARDAAAMRIPKGLSKFQPCLPRDVELDLAVRMRFDPERARQVWATERRIVVQSDGDARS